MIITFGNKLTEQIWNGHKTHSISVELQEQTRRKLRMLNNSIDLNDLQIPPSNRLKKLTGKLQSFYAIRVNKQFRIIFKWHAGYASQVQLIDYHD